MSHLKGPDERNQQEKLNKLLYDRSMSKATMDVDDTESLHVPTNIEIGAANDEKASIRE